jgi:eukaryotic-like serine/threonine-protein kinase
MIGTKIAHYEITSHLGTGGMGEVYQATDSKLGRSVAIKFLPEAFIHDSERVARFEREARVLASLNHPHIAAIHGLEESGERKFLVMELVEGETLADRIKRGPVPVDESLGIAKQIAEALEAAHEKDIIHRDLKPANVKITRDGRVKVLDFGLAKPMQEAQNVNFANSPTLSMPATNAGVILGTAAYMSPEQARGEATDERSDVFSFGCVLYEMLTGQQAFQGKTLSDILAGVLRVDPDFALLPPGLNPKLYDFLRRCLEKDPRRRWYASGDVRLEIESIQSAPKASPADIPRSNRASFPLWKISAASVVIFLLGFGAHSVFWSPSTPAPITRLSFSLPAGSNFTNAGRSMIAMSPDGRKIVYNADRQLWVRSLDKSDAEPIRGTATSTGLTSPFFSPDGQWVGYFADGFLKKIPTTGGAPVSISPNESGDFGASWDARNNIFFAVRSGIMRVSADGGMATTIIAAKPNEAMDRPQMLSDGDHLLFTLTTDTSNDRWEKAQVVIQSLSSGERKVLVQNGSDGRYVPTSHIVYRVGETVFTVGFDSKRLAAIGTPVAVLESVGHAGGVNTAAAQYAFSATGSMAYIPEANRGRHAVFLDSEGRGDPVEFSNDAISAPRVSPDGRRLAALVEGSAVIYDLSGKTAPMRLGDNGLPMWSPDGTRIAFFLGLGEKPGLYLQNLQANAPPELLLTRDQAGLLGSWSSDGRILFFVRNRTIWALTLGEKIPKSLSINSEANSASISPDGHWLAYYSSEGGGLDVFVQPYPPTGAKYQVSRGGGHHPLWSPDGKKLYYVRNTDQLMAVDVVAGSNISFSQPTLLKVPVDQQLNVSRDYDITPDGKRFVVSVPGTQSAPPQIHVVLNWFEELKRLVPLK